MIKLEVDNGEITIDGDYTTDNIVMIADYYFQKASQGSRFINFKDNHNMSLRTH